MKLTSRGEIMFSVYLVAADGRPLCATSLVGHHRSKGLRDMPLERKQDSSRHVRIAIGIVVWLLVIGLRGS